MRLTDPLVISKVVWVEHLNTGSLIPYLSLTLSKHELYVRELLCAILCEILKAQDVNLHKALRPQICPVRCLELSDSLSEYTTQTRCPRMWQGRHHKTNINARVTFPSAVCPCIKAISKKLRVSVLQNSILFDNHCIGERRKHGMRL